MVLYHLNPTTHSLHPRSPSLEHCSQHAPDPQPFRQRKLECLAALGRMLRCQYRLSGVSSVSGEYNMNGKKKQTYDAVDVCVPIHDGDPDTERRETLVCYFKLFTLIATLRCYFPARIIER